MFRNIVITCIALCLFGSLSAQQKVQADSRLIDCFFDEDLAAMQSAQPELISYYNYYLDHSYYMVDLKKAEKEVTGIDIHSVATRIVWKDASAHFDLTAYNKETFNPLAYQFSLQKDSYVTYVWKEAGVAIVFYPLSHIANAFKQSQKNETR